MHINITKSETGNNKGSSGQLVAYLEKENRLVQPNMKKLTNDIKGTVQLQLQQPEYWFNHERKDIRPYEVRQGIDQNVAKLSRDDAKFFLINISPSEKEILHLKALYGEQGAREQLKAYANEVMDQYAKNFKRDNINDNQDLIYFGKLENNRYYTYKDLEVRKGKAKKGEPKPGEQMHVQVIVSRKDASNSIKLSPLNNSKGSNAEHSKKVGQFDRVAFKKVTEQVFDKLFGYDRAVSESFNYANALKNGSYEEKQDARLANKQDVAVRQGQLFSQISSGSLLGELLQPIYIAPESEPKKRKKKKGYGYN